MVSPLQAYSSLQNEREPSKAAAVLNEHMSWSWPTVAFDPVAPPMLQEMADRTAWERFSATDPIAQKEVAAHCLFRAASYQAGATRVRLVELAQELVGEIVNIWLVDRDEYLKAQKGS